MLWFEYFQKRPSSSVIWEFIVDSCDFRIGSLKSINISTEPWIPIGDSMLTSSLPDHNRSLLLVVSDLFFPTLDLWNIPPILDPPLSDLFSSDVV